MSSLRRYLKRKHFRRPPSGPITLYIGDGNGGWTPIASLDTKDFNPTLLHYDGTAKITEPDYSDLESTLNTLGIPLESDLEDGEE